MLLDLKLMFVAFSAGRLPFPNLRFLRGKSVDLADRFFPFIPLTRDTARTSTNAHARGCICVNMFKLKEISIGCTHLCVIIIVHTF